MVINHLMYGIHTSFSFHRGDNICPFSCEKGFHDVDLLKAHIQERKCLLAKEFDNIQEAIRYQAEMEPHLQRAQSLDFTCIPCKKSYATLQEPFLHVQGAGCRYMYYKDIYTNVPVIDKDPRIILLEPRLLQRPSRKKRALIFFRHSANSGHDNTGNTDPHAEESVEIAEDLLAKNLIDEETKLIDVCGHHAKSHRLPTIYEDVELEQYFAQHDWVFKQD